MFGCCRAWAGAGAGIGCYCSSAGPRRAAEPDDVSGAAAAAAAAAEGCPGTAALPAGRRRGHAGARSALHETSRLSHCCHQCSVHHGCEGMQHSLRSSVQPAATEGQYSNRGSHLPILLSSCRYGRPTAPRTNAVQPSPCGYWWCSCPAGMGAQQLPAPITLQPPPPPPPPLHPVHPQQAGPYQVPQQAPPQQPPPLRPISLPAPGPPKGAGQGRGTGQHPVP